MAMGGSTDSAGGDDAPLSFELQVLRNKDRMTEARAHNRPHEYWVYFDTIMRDMVAFMSPSIRAKLEGKYKMMQAQIKAIRDTDAHNASKEKEILDLHVAFADEHNYYISKSLSRSGIVKVKDEGFVNLEKETIDAYASAIRDNKGVDESLERMESSLEADNQIAEAEAERMEKMAEAEKAKGAKHE
jgi:hypothetical protein